MNNECRHHSDDGGFDPNVTDYAENNNCVAVREYIVTEKQYHQRNKKIYKWPKMTFVFTHSICKRSLAGRGKTVSQKRLVL